MKLIDDISIESFLKKYSNILTEPSISTDFEKNKKVKEIFEWLNHYDEYYVIIDFKKLKISWQHGLSSHLGYANDENNILFLRNLIHPFVRDWHSIYMMSLLDETLDFRNILKSRFIINIPIKKSNGTYVFVKQMTLPFELDTNGRIIKYLNVYTIVDQYNSQPLRPRFFEKRTRNYRIEEILMILAIKKINLSTDLNFTKENFQFIDDYVNLINQEAYSTEAMALLLGISQEGVRGRKASIFKKIQLQFSEFINEHPEAIGSENFYSGMPNFKEDLTQSILFLQKSGILTLLKMKYVNLQGKLPKKRNF
jgi:hypothetical protein